MRFRMVVLVLALVPSLAVAESLGDAARRAREKREARAKAEGGDRREAGGKTEGSAPTPVKTYTVEDLNGLPPVQADVGTAGNTPRIIPGTVAPSEAQSVTATEDAALIAGVSSDERVRAAQEAAWRARMAAAVNRLEKAKAVEAGLAKLIMPPNTRMVNRQNGQTIFSSVAQLQHEVQKAKADVLMAQKEVEQVEDDARRHGVPPGWLR